MRLPKLAVITASFLLLYAGATKAQWIETTGPLTSNVHSIAVSGTRVFAGTDNGVFVSSNEGTTWTQVNNGLTDTIIYALAVSGTNILAASHVDGDVSLSTDNGTRWNMVLHTSTAFHSLAVNGSSIYAGNGDGAWLSTDGGTDWNNIGADFPSLTSVYALAVIGTNVFAGTSNGVWLSSDNGAHWTGINAGLRSGDINAFCVSGTNLFAASPMRVYRSTNNGTNWNTIDAGLPGGGIKSLAMSGNNLFAALGGSGIFLTTNNGTDWSADNTGLTNLAVGALCASETNLYTGTYESVVWKRSLSEMISYVENAPAGLPTNLSLDLSANPNPASDQLEIRYNATSPNLEMRLYNILGELVMSSHGNSIGKQLLNIGDLRAGLYLLSLQAGMASATRPVMIVH